SSPRSSHPRVLPSFPTRRSSDLIGVVKKNAILMIDLALQLEREGLDSLASIRQACLLRFRPILMTTLAAILGAVPLLLDNSEGRSEEHTSELQSREKIVCRPLLV